MRSCQNIVFFWRVDLQAVPGEHALERHLHVPGETPAAVKLAGEDSAHPCFQGFVHKSAMSIAGAMGTEGIHLGDKDYDGIKPALFTGRLYALFSIKTVLKNLMCLGFPNFWPNLPVL
jgi:hypothetical protein